MYDYLEDFKNGGKMKKLLILSGILAPVIYVGTVILGGILRPGYSHMAEAISELVSAGAPNKPLLSSLFIVYNILCSAFGIGLLQQTINTSGRKTSGKFGAISLILIGIIGLLLELFFPQDPGGPAVTFAGTLHIILASMAALLTMIAVVATGLWIRQISGFKGYTLYSIITFAVIFVAGGTVPILGMTYPYFGLLERIPIGAFIQWLFVIGLKMYSLSKGTVALPTVLHRSNHLRSSPRLKGGV
jgi:hypothetical membrane protein